MITGNKGEWSELYAFLKLLSEGKVYAADRDINKIPDVCYKIIRIIREESEENYEYLTGRNIVIVNNLGQTILSVPLEEFTKHAEKLLEKIKSQKAGNGAFSFPEIEPFMSKIKARKLAAPVNKKSDIRLMIHDEQTSEDKTLGFSVKSQLGANSTLLNAGGDNTNFVFRIMGKKINNKEIERINNIESTCKIQDRIREIKKLGGEFSFISTAKKEFNSNLEIVDSNLPKILGEIILEYYSNRTKEIKSLIKNLESKNPCSIKNHRKSDFYKIKIKNFLLAIALGMVPGKIWNGEYDATGGYIIVKESGELVCYHLFNLEDFKEYLVNYTYMETPSSGRHKFGKIYKRGNELFFNLNLQIRFNK